MQLQKVHPIIGDVRGKGLMLGVELVVPGTKDPLSPADVADILEITKDSGVLMGRGGRWTNVSYTFSSLAQNVLLLHRPLPICNTYCAMNVI